MATLTEMWFIFYPFFSAISKNLNTEYPLTKFEQFSKCSFGEIFIKRLTASMELVSKLVNK